MRYILILIFLTLPSLVLANNVTVNAGNTSAAPKLVTLSAGKWRVEYVTGHHRFSIEPPVVDSNHPDSPFDERGYFRVFVDGGGFAQAHEMYVPISTSGPDRVAYLSYEEIQDVIEQHGNHPFAKTFDHPGGQVQVYRSTAIGLPALGHYSVTLKFVKLLENGDPDPEQAQDDPEDPDPQGGGSGGGDDGEGPPPWWPSQWDTDDDVPSIEALTEVVDDRLHKFRQLFEKSQSASDYDVPPDAFVRIVPQYLKEIRDSMLDEDGLIAAAPSPPSAPTAPVRQPRHSVPSSDLDLSPVEPDDEPQIFGVGDGSPVLATLAIPIFTTSGSQIVGAGSALNVEVKSQWWIDSTVKTAADIALLGFTTLSGAWMVFQELQRK